MKMRHDEFAPKMLELIKYIEIKRADNMEYAFLYYLISLI